MAFALTVHKAALKVGFDTVNYSAWAGSAYCGMLCCILLYSRSNILKESTSRDQTWKQMKLKQGEDDFILCRHLKVHHIL